MNILTPQHAVISSASGALGGYDPPGGDQLQRITWQYRIQKVSAFIATGNLHLAACSLSLIVLVLSLGLRYLARVYKIKSRVISASSHEAKGHVVPLPFAFVYLMVAIAACCLSWLGVRHSREWKLPIAMTYVVVLGVLRLSCRSNNLKQQIYCHMKSMVTVLLVLAVGQYLAPMTIVGSKYRPSSTQIAFLCCLASMAIVILLSPRPRRHFAPDVETDQLQADERTAPEETCSLFSYYCSYEWMTHVILQGCRRDLTMDDLPPLPWYDDPKKWLKKIKRQRLKGGRTFQTLRRLLRTEIRTMICWAASTSLVEFFAPYAMLRLLAYLEDRQAAIVHPFLWIALLFLGPTMRSVCYQQYLFTATRLLVRVNMSLVQEIYHTAMRSHIYDSSVRRPSSAGHKTTGRSKEAPKSGQANLTSLMSYDVDAIYTSRDIFYVATSGPISTAIAMVFLYQMLGWPSLFGVLALVCLTPLPALASRKVSRIQQSVMLATDVRLSKISEYLNSIRTLKYFGWEPAARNRINEVRGIEQRRLLKRSVYAAAISMAGDLLPFVSLLVIFSIVVLFTDRPLRPPIAFTALSIMETLRSQFVWISNVSRYTAQGAESLRRVDRFFESAEEIKRHPDGPLELRHATFRRTPIAAFKLHDLSISFKPHALNVVTGPTGGGKSSLLLSFLGETVIESGNATCPRDVAYVPQTPWLQNDTIRQNVIFYGQFDKARYETVMEASGLAQDLDQLPNSDLTFVGERGTSLSGGQKQRVSFARALYSRSSTLLLDDIFSALDTHTTSLVYDKCFRSGLLADRTVVLVTSLPAAHRDAEMIIRLEHGRISSVGLSSSSSTESDAPSSVQEQEMDPESLEDLSALQEIEPLPELETVITHSDQEPADQTGRVVSEKSASGRVPRTLFLQYMVMFGGYSYAALAIVATLTVQFAYFSITYWLSIWTEAYSDHKTPNSMFYLSVYAAVIGIFLILQLSNNLVYQYGGWAAAKKMHAKLVAAVMSAPVSWFDENPVGRAINRFGNDTRSMDTLLIDWLRMSIENGLRFLLRIASIASIMPIFALPAAVICSLGFAVGEMYTRAQISIKRLVSVNYSPVFSHFTDTLAGMTVIRAREGMDEVFQGLLAERLAVHTRSAEALYNSNRWVSVRSDFCAASVSAAAGCVAYFKSGAPGLVGFSLSNAIGLSQTILTLVRTMNELEVELNSFQRMREYSEIEPEEDVKESNLRPGGIPASWPTSGRVEFHNVTARYQSDGADVLRNISFAAWPGERIGIVGRTGSGKSTLGLSLLRFVDIVGGEVTLDGIDINQIPLNRLRTSVTLIPQEPVLFSGDVHSNLDPLGDSSDTELRSALSACATIQVPGNQNSAIDPGKDSRCLTLDTPVATNGENFSQGQRQVLSLARALCRRSKVVLLDEATASVDHETDIHMQRLLRSMFLDSTIIAIAHRLRTIMGYDRVLVMAGGEIVENDSPANLIRDRGVFWGMMRNTGEYDELVQLVPEHR